jgi:methionyl-tRNA formyltransferase
MRILYLGMPIGALMLLREGHQLVGACISRPNSPGMSRLRRALAETGAPLLGRPDLTQPGVQALLASTEPDLIVSWFWTRRIPAALVALAPHGGINVHPSLLPRHRGPDPYFWTLYREDAETGVTVHRLTEAYDQGPVLLQRRVPVPPRVNAWLLARALDRPSLEAVRDVVRGLAEGTLSEEGIPQDDALATEAPKPTDDDCEILWDHPASRVIARIRAAAPEPGAFTGLGEGTLVVLDAEAFARAPRGLEPGDVAWLPEGVVVACGGGEAVLLTKARSEDDDTAVVGERIAALLPGLRRVDG